TSGTVILKDINPGAANGNPFNFVAFNNKVYFGANDGTNGYELWETDGTTINTVLVKDINPGPSGSNASPRLVFNNSLIFVADDGVNGVELWMSDGTSI